MGRNDFAEEDCHRYRILVHRRIWYRLLGVIREAVRLAWLGRGRVGEILARGLHSMAMCLFCLISAARGLVYFWNSGWFNLWCMERVSDALFNGVNTG